MKKTIFAEKAPAAVGPYVHAVEAGNMVFTSGQLGLDPENGTLPEGIEAQTHQALKNLGAVLEAAGVGYEDVVRTMVCNGQCHLRRILQGVCTGSFLCGSCKTSEGRSDRDRSNRSKIKEKDTRIRKKYIRMRVFFYTIRFNMVI